MQKYFLLLILTCSCLLGWSQEKNILYLEKSSWSNLIRTGGEEIVYVKFPRFRQDNAVMTCDSAVFYVTKNYFEAFKNVHIVQADTINIYSQRLNYNGNTKMALLSENVRLKDKETTLTTNILDYDMVSKIGTYVSGGKIVNKSVQITSRNGYYFANNHDAYFGKNVVVTTESSTIKSDTLRYNTKSFWTNFDGPTNIKGKDDNLYTENGRYNTKSELAAFGKNNLYTQGSKSLKGDSLYYDGKMGYGKAVKNILFKDTTDNFVLNGQLGEYYKKGEEIIVTINPYIGMETKDTILVNGVRTIDSLWISADTLLSRKVLKSSLSLVKPPVLENLEKETMGIGTAQKPISKQTTLVKETAPLSTKEQNAVKEIKKETASQIKLPIKVDSTTTLLNPKLPIPNISSSKNENDSAKIDTLKSRIIKAFHNVKVFKHNLQAKSDSLYFNDVDSTLRWFKEPILWSDGSQQTGDTIYVHLKKSKLNSFQVFRNAFLVNVDADSSKYNQVKGKSMTGFFVDGELNTILVNGNAESIYYNRNDKKVVTDMSQTVSGLIKVLFSEKQISDVYAKLNVESANTPVDELVGEKLLTGFVWKPTERPVSKESIIDRPIAAVSGKTAGKTEKKTEPTKSLLKDKEKKQPLNSPGKKP